MLTFYKKGRTRWGVIFRREGRKAGLAEVYFVEEKGGRGLLTVNRKKEDRPLTFPLST